MASGSRYGVLSTLLAAALILSSLSGVATASDTAPEGQITAVSYTGLVDDDGDGRYSSFSLAINADTSLDDTDIGSDDAGEPYFLVTLDDYTVYESAEVQRTTSFSGTIPISVETLSNLPAGQYSLTVRLMDQDGDTRGSNDDVIDSASGTISVEPAAQDQQSETTQTTTDEPSSAPIEIHASRTSTVVNAPVSLVADTPATWSIISGPSTSEGQFTVHNGRLTFKPRAPGSYTIRAEPTVDGRKSEVITIDVAQYREQTLIEQYAPVVHFHEDESFWPTRYEALVHNARLTDNGDTVDDQPTMLNIAGKDSSHALELYESPSWYASDSYPTERYGYEPTVYASVQGTMFDGEQYTAVTYWLFYLYDPKGGGTGGFLEHQSDLETVTILLQNGEPEYVAASQHKGGELREWEKTPRDGTHINIYPARGAHSTFLDDSSQYRGEGFLGQLQYLSRSSSLTSILTETLYTDRTGSAQTWRHGHGGDISYDLVPLTGTEGWASYRGSFDEHPGGSHAPMQRGLWNDPGSWIEQYYPNDERQYRASVTNLATAGNGDHVSIEFDLENTGPKPYRATVAVVAKHETADWTAGEILGTQTVRLGTNTEWDGAFDVRLPTGPDGTYDVQVVVVPYDFNIAESDDVIERETVDSAFRYHSASEPQETITTTSITVQPTTTVAPPTTPATTEPTAETTVQASPRSTTQENPPTATEPTSATQQTEQQSTTSTTGPGFVLLTALQAFIIVLLLGRHWR